MRGNLQEGTHRQRWQTVPPIQSLLVFSPFHYIFSAVPSTLRCFSVALAGLKLTLSLRTTLPPKCWGYRCGSPHPVYAAPGGIQDFLILGQQPTQFNYSSTPPPPFKIAIIFSFCVCVWGGIRGQLWEPVLSFHQMHFRNQTYALQSTEPPHQTNSCVV